MMEYVHIYSKSEVLCEMNGDTFDEATASWLCKDCFMPLAGVSIPEIRIIKDTLGNAPLSALSDSNLAVLRNDLFTAIEPYCGREFEVVKLLDESGSLIEDFQIVRPRNEAFVRGTSNVSFRRCEGCGRGLYYASGKRYLCPTPPPNWSIIGSDLAGLLFKKELFERIAFPFPKKHTAIEVLQVKETPLDGLD